jgi:hypothetical protein
MTQLSNKSDREISNWIKNHEDQRQTESDLYRALLLERARRSQASQKMSFENSLARLKDAARDQKCISYGDLAAASGVEWSQARHQMNGPNGHLDRILEICHATHLPLLTAICVNQQNLAIGELGKEALAGFVTGAQRLGLNVSDPLAFHHSCRDECWEWGKQALQARE